MLEQDPFAKVPGHPMGGLVLASIDEVQAWAEANGGETIVRKRLADGFFYGCGEIVSGWLRLQERLRTDAHAAASLHTAERAAVAAERAARYAMWSAAISTASTIVAAATYLVSR